MAERGDFSQWRRWFAATLTVICLSIFTSVSAQDAQKDGQVSTPVSPSAAAPSIDPNKISAPEAPHTTAEAAVEGSSDATAAETLEGDLSRPRRTKPERPFYFTARFSERYDDNVLLRENGRVSDLISVPLIGFGAVRVRPRSLLRIDYLGGAEIHQRFSELDGALQALDFRGEYDISKHTVLFATDGFLQRPQTPGFGLVAGPIGPAGPVALTVLTPTRSIFNDFTTGLTHQLSKFSSLRASYGFLLTRFNNPLLINSDEQVVELGYNRQVSRTRSYDFSYRVSRLSGSGSLTTHTLMPSLQYQRKSRLRLSLGAGPQLASSSITGSQLFLAALAELSYTNRNTTYGLSYTSGVGTGGGLAVATRNQALFATLDHIFGHKLQTESRFGYSRARNNFSLASPLVPVGFTSNEFVFENRIAYTLGNRMAIYFDYSYSHQTGSGGSVGRLNRNLFSVGIDFDTRRSARTPQLIPGRL